MTRPNFLFLFPDQHRGDWMPYPEEIMKSYGTEPLPLRMPNIEKLMKRGVTFTRTVTSSPLCAPARACLASGLRYDKCGVSGNDVDYPLHQRTFYSVLKENGYQVGGVGKFDLNKATPWWGLDGWRDDLGTLGFTTAVDNAGKWDAVRSGRLEPKDPYMKYLHDHHLVTIHEQDMARRKSNPHDSEPTRLPEEAYCDNWLSQQGIQMLRKFNQNQPWFLVVNFTGPHDPWDVTESMKSAWHDVDFPLPNQPVQDGTVCTGIRQNYAAMLENIDRNLGLLLAEVQNRGELENTVIIYSSDHGEMLGDFGRYAKSRPERGSVHIPLVISGPGTVKGTLCDALVEHQDLASTILDFAGLSMEEAVDSLSLLPVLNGETHTHRSHVVSALHQWKMVSDGQYKLVVEGNERRLYDLEQDPWENVNIALDQPRTVAELEQNLGE